MPGEEKTAGSRVTQRGTPHPPAAQRPGDEQTTLGRVKQEAGEATVRVKEERVGGVMPPSCTVLRQTIIRRRRAQGLGDIHVDFGRQVKHELTQEEIDKKERRKEQNRRAARKCRMKRKRIQKVVNDDYLTLLGDNRRMEEEILQLRQEKASLEKILMEHEQSGQCCLVAQATGPGGVPATVTSVQLTTTTATEMLATGQGDQLELNRQAYLQDLGPIRPDQTFTDEPFADLTLDMETLLDIAQHVDLDALQSSAAQDPPAPSFPDPPSAHTPGLPDPMASLKRLMPASPYSSCLGRFSPVSPAAVSSDRTSVSSVSSDRSLSQGLAVPQHQAGSSLTMWADFSMAAAHAPRGSLGESEPMEEDYADRGGFGFASHGLMAPAAEEWGVVENEDGDDDVFHGDFASAVTDESVFQQYRR